MFRLLFVVLAVVGLVSILGNVGAGAAALLFVPILLFKLAFIVMLFGFLGRRFAGSGGDWGHRRGHHYRGRPDNEPDRDERFEEWHRMAHAREEVDSWVEGLPDTEPQ